ncbi:ATP-grasp domain-containing protein [Roseimaritima sediminicola]|uniref:ATP-grasp domain-containing protein n=1 Tax=Roseimaritima sediminicola TaxID=2662066 RepID=UPI00129851E5|nr:ATP-grasp domain-containing protein [Roseimaritima sediminicola]
MQTPHPPDRFAPQECFRLRRVVVVGASARAAAASALAAGYEVAAVDRFGDADLRASVTAWRRWDADRPLHEPLAEVLATDLGTPTAVVLAGGTEAYPDQLAAAAQRLRSPRVRFLMPAQTQLAAAQDPARLGEIAAQGGVAYPSSRPLPSWPQASGRAETLPGRWLVKRRGGCGGLGVADWLPRDPACPDDARSYLQKYVAGVLLGASYCADDAATHLLGVCRGRVAGGAAAPFRYAGSIGPLRLEHSLRDRLQALGEAVSETLGLRGLFGVDLICSKGSLHLLEVNPRYCASMELLETAGRSCVGLHCQAALGDTMDPTPWEHRDAGVRCKRIVYARSHQTWDDRCGAVLHRYLKAHAGDASLTAVCDIPTIGTDLPALAPMFSILTRGPTPSEAYRQAIKHERSLRASHRPQGARPRFSPSAAGR